MSSIDQAFLRAFDADRAPVLQPSAPPAAVPVLAPSGEPAKKVHVSQSNRWFAGAPASASGEPPQPHFVADTLGVHQEAVATSTVVSATPAAPESPPDPDQWRPLSAYTNQREPDDTATTALPQPESQREPFRAALEVDELYWPAPVLELTTRHKALFDEAVAGLANLAVAHHKLFGIVGQSHGVGGTTIAACLARLLASSGRRIALVDADFGSGKLAETLGVAASRGWDESLRTGMPLPECAVHALADGVTLAPLRGFGAVDARVLDTLQTSVLANVLRQGFDAVIADMGCPFSGTQSVLAPLLAARAGLDASIVVTAPGADHRQAVEEATDLLATPCLGYIENQRRS